jgi:single-stranded-DNA-specific exonuclease
MKTWIDPVPTEVPEELIKIVGGEALLAEILFNRGIRSADSLRGFIDTDFYQQTSSSELPGMDEAVARLARAINFGETILVWGDFDVDGQTSTTLLVSILRELGANVEYHIPVREKESHGVNIPVLQELLSRKPKPSLVLTCDTGSASNDAVTYARSQGVEFVISDHHDLPELLPEAIALVNPNFLPDSHPLHTLPGVGVAYKLAEELLKQFDREETVEHHLDLVALGAIADVAILKGDTRYLTQRGLQNLREPRRIGLQEIFELANLNSEQLTEEHIGFTIAPRLNAIGRLDDANTVVELLSTTDRNTARIHALQLEVLNRQRQLLTDQVYRSALQQIEGDRTLVNSAVIVLFHDNWPAGIVGIVASRLVEKYGKPTILITAQSGEFGRGSARSVDGVDITAAISSQKDLLKGYGGHPMAAGLSIALENIPYFRPGISHFVEKAGIPPKPALKIDSYINWGEINLDFVNKIELLAPFGAGNKPIIFSSRDLIVSKKREVGRNKEHLLITLKNKNDLERNVIWWNGVNDPASTSMSNGSIDLAFTVRTTNYRGKPELGIQFVDYRNVSGDQEIQTSKLDVEFVDRRSIKDPLKSLLDFDVETLQIWAEGEGGRHLNDLGINYFGRSQLQFGEKLVIWTTPPGAEELFRVVRNVSPRKIIVYALDPIEINYEKFLSRLMGLVKYVIKNNNGSSQLIKLAELVAGWEFAVRISLDWMAAKGYIRWWEFDQGFIKLESGGKSTPFLANSLLKQLKRLLSESMAYRSYFHRAKIDEIIQQTK